MNKVKIGIILVLGLSLFLIPSFKIKSAVVNLASYNNIRKDIKELNSSLGSIDGRIESNKKAINEAQGDAVNSENVDALFKAVNDLGVTSIEASILSINGSIIKTVSDYTEGQDYTGVDGIQIIVGVEDVDAYMEKLSGLKLTYESLNVVYPEKKIVIRFNTKGGV